VCCNMTKDGFDKITIRVKGYVCTDCGALFVMGLMLLFIVAAVSLAADWSFLSGNLVAYAYFALFAGVFLQFLCVLKYHEKIGEMRR